MVYSFRHSNAMMKGVSSIVYDLPAPVNISAMWNFGSLLGACLLFQIVSGFFLVMHYTPSVELAFYSVGHIIRDVNSGWVIRNCHVNGASLFFSCMYIHIGRGMYYQSFTFKHTWWVGTTIFLLSMMAAFLGYVLPWGQMSFWGATVITSLLSAVPYFGPDIVAWIWGGFAVSDATLKRFFVLHYLIPFVVSGLAVVHLIFLHQTGSNNPLGVMSHADKVPFHNYFTIKDLIGVFIVWGVIFFLSVLFPMWLMDPENFNPADPMNTPLHIQPEWYFLFAYTILRSIDSKFGGVVALGASVLILYVLPFYPKNCFRGNGFYPVSQYFFWYFVGVFMILTFLGACPADWPYHSMSIVASISYFGFYVVNPLMMEVWDWLLGVSEKVNN
uniref:Cytochrome b n=1 Tax=Panopea generosa TaxID=1049056 RepID=A0A0U1XJ52_9BIVA|nr:cytochrome b [Panopea generosa]AIU56055.1 cytochrome b [Panopea generosa]